MSSARHKAAVAPRPRRRLVRIALPGLAAAVVTSSVVGVALGAVRPEPSAAGSAVTAAGGFEIEVPSGHIAERLEDRRQVVSRAAKRVTLVEKPEAVGTRFVTAAVNVRKGPGEQHASLTVVDFAAKLPVTGRTQGDWTEVVFEGLPAWVASDYLVKKKPEPEEQAAETTAATTGGVSVAPCAAGSSIESGIVPEAVTVYRTVCANFPSITSYGGWRGDGEHVSGKAIDIMVSGDLGWQVAEFLRAHAAELNLYDVLYSQRIFTPQRASEGWRYLEDRGSTTANHFDHVHVAVN